LLGDWKIKNGHHAEHPQGLVGREIARGHIDLPRCRSQSGGVGIWPESGRMTRPKNPPKKAVMSQIRTVVLRASELRGPEALLAATVIAQAIFDARTSAEARRSLMPGEGCELWAGALGIRPEYPREIAETLGYLPRERMAA
jgi:hypothetical protein